MKVLIPFTDETSLEADGTPTEIAELLHALLLQAQDPPKPPPAPTPKPAAKKAPKKGGCEECGSRARHRSYCSKAKQNGTKPNAVSAALEELSPRVVQAIAEASKRRRSVSHGGMKLGDDVWPDYSKHGDLYELPANVRVGAEGERMAAYPPGPGELHAHRFRIPAVNGFPESLGRCSCGATRRFQNAEAVA